MEKRYIKLQLMVDLLVQTGMEPWTQGAAFSVRVQAPESLLETVRILSQAR